MKAPTTASLRGRIKVPGDKSIAHRALILGALAEGKTRIRGLPLAGDVDTTRACMAKLGAEIVENKEGEVVVKSGPLNSVTHLDAGNSGTTARLLAGVLAARPGRVILEGDESLNRRPMERVAHPLRLMGARIKTDAGRLPMQVEGGALRAIEYAMPVASAQVKSCVLLAGLAASGVTTVVEKVPTRDHTERMLQSMTEGVKKDGNRVEVVGGSRLVGTRIDIPGDISSALFWGVASILVPGSDLIVEGIGMNPSRTGALDVLKKMGASIQLENFHSGAEAHGDLRFKSGPLAGTHIGGLLIPRLIDELPILAVAATQAEGETRVVDAAELRHKESDRIACLCMNLRRMGADVQERPDGFIVRGPTPLRGAVVDSHGDHRLAMAFAVASLIATGPTEIKNHHAARISYPAFFEELHKKVAA
jgi:3-phosphoshikimate 1-carboxyvinyltransferase